MAKTGSRGVVETRGSERLWKVVSLVAGLAAARVAQSALDGGWQKARGGDPPTNPHALDTTWGEAFAWAALSGAALGLARLVAQSGAAGAWLKAMGGLPPGLEEGATR